MIDNVASAGPFRASLPYACLLICLALPAATRAAADQDLLTQTRALDNRTQVLKKEVMELGRKLAYLAWVGGVRPQQHGKQRNQVLSNDMLKVGQTLARLEDGLLAPPGIQLVVFVSVAAPQNFDIQQLQLKLGRDVVQKRSYNESELDALRKGAAQRLYIGNIPEGSNLLNISMTAHKGKKEYFTHDSYPFTKGHDRKTIEIHIGAGLGKPDIDFKEWD